jgi:hypothetical protein
LRYRFSRCGQRQVNKTLDGFRQTRAVDVRRKRRRT